MIFYIIYTRKVSAVAFSFLFSKILRAKLCLFVVSATFAASHWHFVSICSCFFMASVRKFVMLVAQMRGQATRNLLVVGSNPPKRKFCFSRFI